MGSKGLWPLVGCGATLGLNFAPASYSGAGEASGLSFSTT